MTPLVDQATLAPERISSSGGLLEVDFERIAENGFGDGLNSYAHSMAWFQDHLYVGTTRANLCMVKAVQPPGLDPWPTRCPEDIYDLDRRAQIWRFSPATGEWRQVYTSPLVARNDGRDVPRDIGYRGMTVFRAAGEAAPAIYTWAWAPARAGLGPVMLRCSDGMTFEPVSLSALDASINTYRTLSAFDGRLFTSPTGKTLGWRGSVHRGMDSVMSGVPVVLESSAPSTDGWTAASSPGFGDPDNATIFDMAEFNGYLYAGTVNPETGCQVWKTDARGTPPYRWTRVLSHGAHRGKLNEVAGSFCTFNGALYVGTGIQQGGYDRSFDIGPAASELIRVHPDDSWDLIAGTPRATPQGFKHPLCGMGPGFDNPFNGYFWRITAHDGWLYVGTYDWSILLKYTPMRKWPAPIADAVRRIGVERLIEQEGGFDLWRSRDGERWEPVTRRGFGNPYNFGVRTLVSTPRGLFIGTANPFAPEVATRTAAGWEYVDNPRGGLEVFWGGRGPGPGRDVRAGG